MQSGKSRPEKRVNKYNMMIARLRDEFGAEEDSELKIELLEEVAQAYVDRHYGGDITPTEEELEARRERQAAGKQHNETVQQHRTRLKRIKKERRNANRLADMRSRVDKAGTKFICIDLEMWERKQSAITEIGISEYDLAGGGVKTVHIIVEENLKRRNGRFVADNKDNFLHGVSTVMKLNDALEFTREAINRHTHAVGHSISGDLKALCKRGIDTSHLNVIDTQHMHMAERGLVQPQNLTRSCERYHIRHLAPHNAGNDSHANMYLFIMLFRRFKKLVDPNKDVTDTAPNLNQAVMI